MTDSKQDLLTYADLYRCLVVATEGLAVSCPGRVHKLQTINAMRKQLASAGCPTTRVRKTARYSPREMLAWMLITHLGKGAAVIDDDGGETILTPAQLQMELTRAQLADKRESARARKRINDVAEGGLIPVEVASQIVADGLSAASRLLRDALADMVRQGQDTSKLSEVQGLFESRIDSIVSQFIDAEGQAKTEAAKDLKAMDRKNAK